MFSLVIPCARADLALRSNAPQARFRKVGEFHSFQQSPSSDVRCAGIYHGRADVSKWPIYPFGLDRLTASGRMGQAALHADGTAAQHRKAGGSSLRTRSAATDSNGKCERTVALPRPDLFEFERRFLTYELSFVPGFANGRHALSVFHGWLP
jgi:hypothetical protein